MSRHRTLLAAAAAAALTAPLAAQRSSSRLAPPREARVPVLSHQRFIVAPAAPAARIPAAPCPPAGARAGDFGSLQADTTRVPLFGPIAGATVGAAGGAVLGILAGFNMAWDRGGEDPGLISALVLGSLASMLGAGTGAQAGMHRRIRIGPALEQGFPGVVTGVLADILLAHVVDLSPAGALVGFSVSAGVVTGLIVHATER